MESLENLPYDHIQRHNTIHASTVIRAQSAGGRVSLPVRNAAGFTWFRHLEGFPGGGDGYSLARLRSLDSMIERLVRLSEHTRELRTSDGEGASTLQRMELAARQLHEMQSGTRSDSLQLSYSGIDARFGEMVGYTLNARA
jgi:hypothetical protein